MVRRKAFATVLLTVVALASVQADAFELNGLWASDPELCDKIFAKEGNEVVFAPLSDFYGSGFIIDGDRMRGKLGRCTIRSRTQEGATVNISAACTSSIAAQDMKFSLKVTNENTITRIYTGLSGMEVQFHRCTL